MDPFLAIIGLVILVALIRLITGSLYYSLLALWLVALLVFLSTCLLPWGFHRPAAWISSGPVDTLSFFGVPMDRLFRGSQAAMFLLSFVAFSRAPGYVKVVHHALVTVALLAGPLACMVIRDLFPYSSAHGGWALMIGLLTLSSTVVYLGFIALIALLLLPFGISHVLGRSSHPGDRTPASEAAPSPGSPPKRRTMAKGDWIAAGIAGTFLVIVAVQYLGPGWRRDPGVTRLRTDMLSIQDAALNYRAEFKRWPDGEPADILRVLRGDNSRKIVFLEVAGPASGATRDPWGTSYRVTFAINTVITRSAGPNRLWNDRDDLEARKTVPGSTR